MNYKIKPIRNEEYYNAALEYLNKIFDSDRGTPEFDDMEVLSILIEKYENEHYSINLPDPVEAIKFRMEQADLSQKDLVPYIGSRSKVSEILSGKRNLTLKMIRSLHRHLGIPAEVLLQDQPILNLNEFKEIEFRKFPLIEMEKNGAFKDFDTTHLKDKAEEAIRFLIDKIGGIQAIPEGLFIKTNPSRLNAKTDPYALQGWSLQVLAEGINERNIKPYIQENINESFLKGLVSLSTMNEGPRLSIEYFVNHGIILKIIPHLKNTYIDGASFITREGRPVIGLTLRYDRIDNFWFTLLHELGHVVKHLEKGNFIADDMTLRGSNADNDEEIEADNFAEKALLPEDFDLDKRDIISKQDVLDYATIQNVHHAIVAGRIQYTKNNYRLFSNLVGRGEVRKCFEI